MTALQWHNVMVIAAAIGLWLVTLGVAAYCGVWMFELIERIWTRG